MRDVAALAGVSVKTVSRVVNDEPGVTEALSRRVSAAVAELGYRHNLTASHLRRGHRTASIGVLVQDLSNEFCGAVLRAIEDRARAEGVVVIASSIDEDAELERETAHGLVARRIDGLILMPASRHQDYLDTDRAVRPGGGRRRPSTARHGHRRRRGRQPGRRGRGSRSPDLARAPPDRLPGRQREHLHRGGTTGRLPNGAASVSDPPDPDLEQMDLRTRRTPPGPRTSVLGLDDPPTAIFAARNVICTGAVLALQQLSLSDDGRAGRLRRGRDRRVRPAAGHRGPAGHPHHRREGVRPAPRQARRERLPRAHRGGPDDPGEARIRRDQGATQVSEATPRSPSVVPR